MNPQQPSQPQPNQQPPPAAAPPTRGLAPTSAATFQSPLPTGPAMTNPQYATPLPGMDIRPGSSPVPAPGVTRPAAAPKINPNSTQNTLQIAEIRDGIVIMSDGSFRSVVMVKSINFDLMSPQEREAVEYSYQGFLNSLYFPVQIFIRSSKVDLRPYIERLDKIRAEHDNMLLSLLMEDYISFIDNISLETNIMDKKFYVVVPFFPEIDAKAAIKASKNLFGSLKSIFRPTEQHVVIDEQTLEKAKTELRNRVQAVLAGLLQCSIQGLPLDTQELIELYYDTYNPDTATRQQLRSFDELEAPVVTKGTGAAPQPNLEKEMK